jgi:hypothetical protein
MYEDERLPWETDGDLPWATNGTDGESPANDTWRGDLHFEHWPEELAGPEYWLYKRLGEDEA